MAREGRGGLLHAIRSCSQHVQHEVDRPSSCVSHCIRSGHAARHVEHEVDRPSTRCRYACNRSMQLAMCDLLWRLA
ncbi:hypothetical protein F2Q70_00011003 [Brassica cretica]|uniref:Uncharacterized protein n=1 Tax=Brassica cretica TaxID=69181 RepID=A0A8S9LV89_BRACR|nr:hypothetical protein F2Q70_00011003 [Brassica cretica]